MMDRLTVMGCLEGLTQDDWEKWYSDSEVQETAKAALSLLKEQETYDTRESRIFQCEKCGYGIEDIFLNSEHDYPIIPVYCPNCGRAVKSG